MECEYEKYDARVTQAPVPERATVGKRTGKGLGKLCFRDSAESQMTEMLGPVWIRSCFHSGQIQIQRTIFFTHPHRWSEELVYHIVTGKYFV